MYELSQPDDDQYRLRICHVSRRDIGPLTCTARNRHGTQACSVTLELAGESQSLQPSSSPLVPILTGFSQDSLYQPSQKWPSCVPPRDISYYYQHSGLLSSGIQSHLPP